MDKTSASSRVYLLDEIRGLAILGMVVCHAMYSLTDIFDFQIPFFFSPFMSFVMTFGAGVFIFISGIASRYSRSNLRRGVITLALGYLITAVTWLVMPSERILFGILHFLGSCMILFGLLRPLLDRIPAWLTLLASALLFWVTFRVQSGYLTIPFAGAVPLPAAWYQTTWLYPLGFPQPSFFSADYFPLLGWMFLFFAGTAFGVYVKAGKMPAFCYRMHCRPLAWIGRHTIYIYLIHQPLIIGVTWLILRITAH